MSTPMTDGRCSQTERDRERERVSLSVTGLERRWFWQSYHEISQKRSGREDRRDNRNDDRDGKGRLMVKSVDNIEEQHFSIFVKFQKSC